MVCSGSPTRYSREPQRSRIVRQQPLGGLRQQPLAGAIHQPQRLLRIEGKNRHLDLFHHLRSSAVASSAPSRWSRRVAAMALTCCMTSPSGSFGSSHARADGVVAFAHALPADSRACAADLLRGRRAAKPKPEPEQHDERDRASIGTRARNRLAAKQDGCTQQRPASPPAAQAAARACRARLSSSRDIHVALIREAKPKRCSRR